MIPIKDVLLVMVLAAGCDNENYRVREQSAQQLNAFCTTISYDIRPILRQIIRNTKSPDVRSRCRKATRCYERISPPVWPGYEKQVVWPRFDSYAILGVGQKLEEWIQARENEIWSSLEAVCSEHEPRFDRIARTLGANLVQKLFQQGWSKQQIMRMMEEAVIYERTYDFEPGGSYDYSCGDGRI